MSDRERAELDERDRALLFRWRLAPDDPRAREVVLVGQLQTELGVQVVDGQYGPHMHATLREKELPLGLELSSIVKEYQRRRRSSEPNCEKARQERSERDSSKK